MKKSIEFNWNPDEFNNLLKSCREDDGINLSLKHLNNKNAKILEAGAGSGRVVKYLYGLGFKNIYGVELNSNTVKTVNEMFPELNIIQGNILKIPYNNFFDVVLAYGIIEHFPNGLQAPLKELYRVLKHRGIAIITVPSFNKVRRMKYFIGKNFSWLLPKKNNFIRKIFGKKEIIRNKNKFNYYIYPQFGAFFEYRLTPKQFENECTKAGFKIIQSIPIAHIDGIYHEFGEKLCQFRNWQFYPNKIGKFTNNNLKKIPFFHNHMHACVLQK